MALQGAFNDLERLDDGTEKVRNREEREEREERAATSLQTRSNARNELTRIPSLSHDASDGRREREREERRKMEEKGGKERGMGSLLILLRMDKLKK